MEDAPINIMNRLFETLKTSNSLYEYHYLIARLEIATNKMVEEFFVHFDKFLGRRGKLSFWAAIKSSVGVFKLAFKNA